MTTYNPRPINATNGKDYLSNKQPTQKEKEQLRVRRKIEALREQREFEKQFEL